MKRNRTREGRIFGRLTILEKVRASPHNDGNDYYKCQCSCGNIAEARWKNMLNGAKKSCGCLYDENLSALKAAGEENRARKKLEAEQRRQERGSRPLVYTHPLYNTYRKMIERCYDKRHDSYRYYGGRGISVCQEWRDDFWVFVRDMGEKPDGCYLDRTSSDGNYDPDNCRWASKEQQFSNVRNTPPCYVATIRGVRKLVTDWAREKGVNQEKIKADIRKGMRPEVAVVAAVFRKQVWEKSGPQPAWVWADCLTRAIAWVSANP